MEQFAYEQKFLEIKYADVNREVAALRPGVLSIKDSDVCVNTVCIDSGHVHKNCIHIDDMNKYRDKDRHNTENTRLVFDPGGKQSAGQ